MTCDPTQDGTTDEDYQQHARQVAYHTLLSQLAAQSLLSGRLGDEELAAGLARFKASVEDEKVTP